MKMNWAIFTLLTVFIFGCENTNDKLFWIDEPAGQENDFLFLVESTNVEQLNADSLKLFLTRSEFENIQAPPTTYRNFGQLRKQDNFTVFVLLQEIDTIGRNYNFLIRTYDNRFQLIDGFELGAWDEKAGRYCFGSINKYLIIERKCKGEETPDIMQVTNEGKIVMTSFHKP